MAFFIVQVSYAAGERKGFVKIGGLEIVPKLSIGGQYTTNTFNEADLGDVNGDGDTKDPDESEDDDFFLFALSGS